MANRNVARHLLLVASILLCFFVYMGYRLMGQGDDAAPSASTEAGGSGMTDIAGLTPLSPALPSGDEENASSRVRPAAAETTRAIGMPMPPAPPRSVQAAPASTSTPSPAFLRPPPGSLEESSAQALPPFDSPTAAGAANNGSGIAGLTPAAPLPPPASSLPSLIGQEEAPSAPVASSLPPGMLTPPGGAVEAKAVLPLPGEAAAPGGLRPASGVVPPIPPDMASSPARNTERQPESAPLQPRRERPAVAPGPDAVPPAGILAAEEDSLSDSLRMYVVRPGDTLSRIATRELGSISLADNIFLLNRDVIPDPDQLMAGVKIRLPVRSQPGMDGEGQTDSSMAPGLGAADDWSAGGDEALPGQVRVHTVAPGDTLSSISMRYYGSSSGWRFLYEVNTKTIANPNRLSVGTELVVPPYGEEQ